MVPASIIIIIAFVGFFTWVGLSWRGVIKRQDAQDKAIADLRDAIKDIQEGG